MAGLSWGVPEEGSLPPPRAARGRQADGGEATVGSSRRTRVCEHTALRSEGSRQEGFLEEGGPGPRLVPALMGEVRPHKG